MPGEDIPSSLYDWKENYCDVCHRYVELDEFETTEDKIMGKCVVCGKVIYEVDKTKENKSVVKYTIKPLEWKRLEDIEIYEDVEDKYTARPGFGYYDIELDSGTWYVRYCFDEYFDEGYIDGKSSLEEAKKLAQSHWEERLGRSLITIQ